MTLQFTKMHGLGNDFMVLDLVRQQAEISSAWVQSVSNRKTGIGFDQLLIIESTDNPDCDFAYRIYNADGSEVEHCGNGIRCVSQFVLDQALTSKTGLAFVLAGKVLTTQVSNNGLVRVDMGAPILLPADIPFSRAESAAVYPLQIDGQNYEVSAISMGNPHAVMLTDDVQSTPVGTLGPLIENHPDFPNRVNAGFMEVVNTGTIRLRVFERGTGETLACGTGACAAVVAGRLRGLLDEHVQVETRGGILTISWAGAKIGDEHPVYMTGPTATVFEGQVDL